MDSEGVWHNNAYTSTQSGEYVYVDQLKSPTPGLIAQLTMRLITKCYNIEMICFDQLTRFSYDHLQTTDISKKTLKYKQTFELIAQQHGVKIKAYHVDNGIFQSHAWMKSCTKKSQALTFAGSNTHQKNSIS